MQGGFFTGRRNAACITNLSIQVAVLPPSSLSLHDDARALGGSGLDGCRNLLTVLRRAFLIHESGSSLNKWRIMYTERFYRSWISSTRFESFRAVAGESDLQIYADTNLRREALAALMDVRKRLREHIACHPRFLTSLVPVETGTCDPFLKGMEDAGKEWSTGPMAAVAGAIAQYVGEALLEYSDRVVVENGGDVWALSPSPLEMLVYPGEESPLSTGIRFTVDGSTGIAVCTSSGVVGPSFSMGKADSVTTLHRSGALADAAATSLANRIRGARDVTSAVESVSVSRRLKGVLALCGDSLGIWGDIRLRKEA